MDSRVLAEAAALADARRPYALATVVWRRAPSSGQVGSKAIVQPDGSVHGWFGGACAEPTVVREALAALQDGMPRLLFLGPPEEVPERDGTIVVPMACDSEGAIEVYVEPFLPRPQLVVVGRSPAVHALTLQARAIYWDVVVVDDGGQASDHPCPELVRTTLDLEGLGVSRSSAIVVATQGHYDDVALRAAVSTDAGYIGVVAAEKRASALKRLLHDQGIDEAQLARIHAPAGLDLGVLANVEISVAVLADLVARRASGELRAVAVRPVRTEARDPVCGMVVHVEDAKHHALRDGLDNWFCSATCLATFQERPQ
jgi:xanthine dehydrogenase accessory factor